jgi:DNA-binding XRE family transcriptional regulator
MSNKTRSKTAKKIRDEVAFPVNPEARYPFEPPFGEVGMGPDELEAIGEIDPDQATVQGAYFALAGLVKTLKARRESMGLSLTDVSERSGLTRQVISKIENGRTINPTLDTLFRYSMALDALVTLGIEDIEPEE